MSLQQNVGWSIRFFLLALLLVWHVGAAAAADVDQAWIDSVAALDPQKQVEAVTAKMQDVNPGFKEKLEAIIKDGNVIQLYFDPTDATDLRPLRALESLRKLTMDGGLDTCKLADLSGLRGLSLNELRVSSGRLADLGPLEGMPLTCLEIYGEGVADLKPLRKMPLRRLDCRLTAVRDLSPPADSPLEQLECSKTRITDLKPLAKLPLKWLNCNENPCITDLAPLRGLRLLQLNCGGTGVSEDRQLSHRQTKLR
jgi:hypothetical protein